MIGEIVNAVLLECRQLLSGSGAEVILKSNMKAMSKESYSGNFILLDISDGIDSKQYANSMTQMDWRMGFNSYNFEPDAYVDDMSGYSTNLLNFIDEIRQHFSSGLVNDRWLTQGMTDVFNAYGFQFTFGGMQVADALELDGVMMGWKIDMESTACDPTTQSIVYSAEVLEHITGEVDQEDIEIDTVINEPYAVLPNILTNANQTLPGNIFVQSINMKPNTGTPLVRVGTTIGGNEIIDDTQITEFQRIITDDYFPDPTTLFFTVTGGSVKVNIMATENFL